MQLDTMTLITLSLVRDHDITLSSPITFKYILNLFFFFSKCSLSTNFVFLFDRRFDYLRL